MLSGTRGLPTRLDNYLPKADLLLLSYVISYERESLLLSYVIHWVFYCLYKMYEPLMSPTPLWHHTKLSGTRGLPNRLAKYLLEPELLLLYYVNYYVFHFLHKNVRATQALNTAVASHNVEWHLWLAQQVGQLPA
jgi:hypothetical protein